MVKRSLFLLLILSAATIFIFYPVLQQDLIEQDWIEIERIKADFGTVSPLNIPKRFYLSEYGTLWGSTALTYQLFGSNLADYRLLNLALRLLAAYSLYLLVRYWSGRQIFGFISAFFFMFSYGGLENTIWSIHHFAYSSVILFCLSLYFWKKYHDRYRAFDLFLSFFIFAVSIFIGHIRIFMLPFILLAGEIYFFITSKKRSILHIAYTILLLLFMLITLFGTNLYHGVQAAKVVHPLILARILLEGTFPILGNFFLFISNLVFPYFLVAFLFPDAVQKIDIQFFLSLTIIIWLIGSLFIFINIFKKRFAVALASLMIILYPLVVYRASNYLSDWSPSLIISAAIGGTAFILITITSFVFWKTNRQYVELVVLGFATTVTHLALPWSMFPLLESNNSSLTDFASRYYTVPSFGVSIMIGFIFTISFDAVRRSITGHRINRAAFTGGIVIICTLLIIFFQASYINKFFKSYRKDFPNINRHEQLWKTIKPFFEAIEDKKSEKIVYVEGYRDNKDAVIIKTFLPYQLAVEQGFLTSDRKRSVSFVLNKDEIISTLKAGFDAKRFFAIKIENDHLSDIKAEIVSKARPNE